ncbi:MAG: hypothetical protein OEM43_02835 [Gammaproteobacteria bacterium]|nr:hypothetical protein [Gammaproteobacteria bacterium]
MNKPVTLIDAQLQRLLEVVERHRDERCKALLEQAEAEAQQLVKRAWHEARARLHQAVLDNREQVRRQLASAQARNQTRLRAQRQREDQALLARAWQTLGDKLLQRWQQVDSRQQWIDELLVQASAMLIDPHWHIEHPADWPQTERDAMETRLSAELGQAPVFSAQTGVAAGLRICTGDTCIDGTARGLLRARELVEARMLAALNDCREASATASQDTSDEQSSRD